MPPSVSPVYDVFVSYSHADLRWVQDHLVPNLEGLGFKVAVDYRDFRGGSTGIEEMERCTLESKRVICVFSPEYVLSEWTKFENIMAQALDPGAVSRKVVPVLYKDCDIPLRLRILHYRDMRVDAPEAWALLARDLM